MSWIIIAIIAYFFLALVNVFDKVFLEQVISDSRVYGLLISLLGGVVVVAIPFLEYLPGASGWALDLIAGALFTAALLSFFESLKRGNASWVIPIVGSGVPVISLILSSLFLGDRLGGREYLAFFLLLLGGTALVLDRSKRFVWDRGMTLALAAAFFFGVSFVLSKYAYDTQGILTGFVLVRLGSCAAAACIFFIRPIRRAFGAALRSLYGRRRVLFIGNQGIGAAGFILQNWAIALGSVSLVNALQGVQYVFVVGLIILFSRKYPSLMGERLPGYVLIEKIAAIGIIGIGLFVLATGAV